MKHFTTFAISLSLASAATFGLSACSDNDSTEAVSAQDLKDATLSVANIQFVNATVIPTYKTLADKAIALQEAVETLQQSKTDANVSTACDLWRESRQYWEWSEAFLFGAASKYYIDPHIDTWPLDVTALNSLLNSPAMMADIENTVGNLNYGLVGFHALEYIIFRNGSSRSASQISDEELRYAAAVAADLSLSCCRLEAAWAGLDHLTDAKQSIITEAEMEPEDNFGEQMQLCGQAGSLWKSITAGSEQIIEGCKDIADEVGNQKIGKPAYGEDVTYIESPNSYNSITDFEDNIVSIRNTYYGGLGATTPQVGSLSLYVQSINAEADNALKAAIATAIAKIQAMPKPFVLNYTDPACDEAAAACNDLNDALEVVRKAIVGE